MGGPKNCTWIPPRLLGCTQWDQSCFQVASEFLCSKIFFRYFRKIQSFLGWNVLFGIEWKLDCKRLRHSMLRLDATTKKRYNGKLFKFKKFSIKQAIFITDIFPSRVKAPKQKKLKFYFTIGKILLTHSGIVLFECRRWQWRKFPHFSHDLIMTHGSELSFSSTFGDHAEFFYLFYPN